MFNRYSNRFINIVSIIITVIIMCFVNIFISQVKKIDFSNSIKINFSNNKSQEDSEENDINSMHEDSNKQEENTEAVKSNVGDSVNITDSTSGKQAEEVYTWYLEIPSINLKAEIAEGTSKEVMDDYIGHFEETDKTEGTIGLAAHNRGYKNNYFENLKKLKEGDELIYIFGNYKKVYEVKKHIIIEDTNWEYLEREEDKNQLTLITCVENEPNYRRCIVGVEK